MTPVMTKEQSMMWAHSIVRDAPWTKPSWPTKEEVDAFFQTDFGKEVAKCFEERDRKNGIIR